MSAKGAALFPPFSSLRPSSLGSARARVRQHQSPESIESAPRCERKPSRTLTSACSPSYVMSTVVLYCRERIRVSKREREDSERFHVASSVSLRFCPPPLSLSFHPSLHRRAPQTNVEVIEASLRLQYRCCIEIPRGQARVGIGSHVWRKC